MKLNAFSKSYEGRQVLSFPDTEIPDGKICVLIGANGSGKTTMARVLSGVEKAESGGAPLASELKVGYMPQKSFAFRMSTLANICLAGGNEKDAETLLERLQLGHLAKRRAKRLSGGEMARMALARLLIRRYDLLILDEPTASMDMESTALTEALVMDYCRESGCTVLWVTHSLQQARRVADTVLFLHKGSLLESGPAATLLYAPEKEETKQFLEFYGI